MFIRTQNSTVPIHDHTLDAWWDFTLADAIVAVLQQKVDNSPAPGRVLLQRLAIARRRQRLAHRRWLLLSP